MMNRFFIAILFFIIGCFAMYILLSKNHQKVEEKQTQVVIEQIRSLKKLIVTEGIFSETFSYKDSKNYLYDLLQFEKQTFATVNAKVQVSYNLGLLEIETDEKNKTIYLKNIPEPEIEIIPKIRYYNMQQSSFNSFDSNDLNNLQEEAILRITETAEVAKIKERAKKDLIKELNKVYLLTNALGWKLVDETAFYSENQFLD